MRMNKRFVNWILAAAGALVLSAVPARANLVFSVQFVNASAGSTGNPIEVLLQNTGAPVTIASFNFTINTANTDITFTGTDVNTTAAPYIFAGDSFDVANSFPPNTLPAGQVMDGTDLSNSGNGTLVGTGATFGLGRVLFNVAAGAVPGSYPVTFLNGAGQESLFDAAGQPLAIDTFNNGQITITSAAVPEPATGLLVIGALAGVFFTKRRTA